MSLGVFFTCEYENQLRKIVKVNKHIIEESNSIIYLDIVLSGNQNKFNVDSILSLQSQYILCNELN